MAIFFLDYIRTKETWETCVSYLRRRIVDPTYYKGSLDPLVWEGKKYLQYFRWCNLEVKFYRRNRNLHSTATERKKKIKSHPPCGNACIKSLHSDRKMSNQIINEINDSDLAIMNNVVMQIFDVVSVAWMLICFVCGSAKPLESHFRSFWFYAAA